MSKGGKQKIKNHDTLQESQVLGGLDDHISLPTDFALLL
jgi:hypothetical protein